MSKKIIRLTESELKRLIIEAVKNSLNEGIRINRTKEGNFVTFDDSENGLIDGPVVGEITLPQSNLKVTTYSMFKRVGAKNASDANPLLFALKRKNNWTLTNLDAFWERFGEILTLFLRDHSLEKIVMLPSTHDVNSIFASKIKELSPDTIIYEGFLTKLSVEEIEESIDEPNSYFRQYWLNKGGQAELDAAHELLQSYLNKMEDGIFSYSSIPSMELKKSIINTLKLTELGERYCDEINGKDILLLDDSIAAGQTAESAINALNQCYTPNSISLITLFSQKF